MTITDKIIENHGLKKEEYKKIISLLGRKPNLLELGIFSAMWNEHCSYKSSKKYLRKLPTKNKYVIQGPGENAGVISVGEDDAIVFKIESHNHPSFIEPYQGAATGVGGILRDVFTMGARPIATLNSLHFGSPDHPKTKNLLNGVVSGIGGYGNCMGIPNAGGEVKFNSSYNENILVNAMAIGHVNKKKFFIQKQKVKTNQLSMLVQKLEEMEYMVQVWLRLNLMKMQKIKNLQYKLVIHLQKSFF